MVGDITSGVQVTRYAMTVVVRPSARRSMNTLREADNVNFTHHVIRKYDSGAKNPRSRGYFDKTISIGCEGIIVVVTGYINMFPIKYIYIYIYIYIQFYTDIHTYPQVYDRCNNIIEIAIFM